MNLRKAIFVFGGCTLILIILAYRFGLFKKSKSSEKKETISAQVVKPKVSPKPKIKVEPKKEDNKPIAVVEEKKEEKKTPVMPLSEFGTGNPFAYSSASDGSYSPSLNNNQVGSLTVKGIISMEGLEPMAILHMNGDSRVYYVKKNDVIRVNVKSKTAALVTESYIVVKDIREDEVELVQQERPDKVIIVR